MIQPKPVYLDKSFLMADIIHSDGVAKPDLDFWYPHLQLVYLSFHDFGDQLCLTPEEVADQIIKTQEFINKCEGERDS